VLSKEQSDAVAVALLLPARHAKEAAEIHKEEQRRKLAAQRRFVRVGFFGFLAGGAIGYLIFGNIWPTALAGIGVGFILGKLILRRGT